MRSKINYFIGNIFRKLGYVVVPSYRWPRNTLNPVQLGLAALHSQECPLIVQCGAFDGCNGDPLQELITTLDPRAILVEPQPGAFNRLRELYENNPKIALVNAALTESDGKVPIFLPAGEDYSMKASLNEGHMQRFGLKRDQVKKIDVDGVCVETLMDKYSIKKIDLLQLDTEGHDFIILKAFLAHTRPVLINMEKLHLMEKDVLALRACLEEHGYAYLEYGIDIFAVHSESLVDSGQHG